MDGLASALVSAGALTYNADQKPQLRKKTVKLNKQKQKGLTCQNKD